MSGLIGSPLLQPAELLASLAETFTSGLSTVRSSSPLPDMTTVATGQFPPTGLTPAGPTISVAAQLPSPHLIAPMGSSCRWGKDIRFRHSSHGRAGPQYAGEREVSNGSISPVLPAANFCRCSEAYWLT